MENLTYTNTNNSFFPYYFQINEEEYLAYNSRLEIE
jgi:hypothetical protein